VDSGGPESAFAVGAVAVSIFLPCNLGPVPHQEAGVAGELVVCLGNDLHDQFLGDKLASRNAGAIQPIGLIEFEDDAACVRCIGGLKRLQRVVLRFLDVGAELVVIGCHLGVSLFFGSVCRVCNVQHQAGIPQ
jgi:hypothetical protein